MKPAPLHPKETRRLEALRRTELLDSAPAPEFDDATRLASFICGTPIALVSLVDEHRQWFKSRVGLAASETPRDQAFCAHAILGTEVFIVPDARADPRFADNPLVTGGPNIGFYAGAPLITADGDALGTICVISHEPRALSGEQREALAALARQVVAQIDLLERTRTLVARAHEMSIVNEMGELLQSCHTAEETHEVVAVYAPRLFPSGHGSVSIITPARDQVEQTVAWGQGRGGQPSFTPDECWALRRGRAHHVSADLGGAHCRHARREDRGGYVCVPMVADGETLGIVHLSDAGGVESDARVQLAITTAERVGLALANARLRESLRAQSIRDPLTGLFNRRYLEESLERDVRRCQRHQRPLSILAIDVDHFKRFNDTHGHDGGDALLKALGAELQRRMRGEDIVCRHGGEEFVIVLPEACLEPSIARAQELCDAAKALSVRHRGQELPSAALSIGVATLGAHGACGSEVLKAADQALYRAKAEGRDRVVVAGADASARVSDAA